MEITIENAREFYTGEKLNRFFDEPKRTKTGKIINNYAKYTLSESQLRRNYTRLKSAAKVANREMNLSLNDFAEIRTDNACVYCGDILPKTSYGIDRKDSSLGYIKGNCVACCSICNRAKSNFWSHAEWLLIMAITGKKWTETSGR
jgi:hypothetical protein